MKTLVRTPSGSRRVATSLTGFQIYPNICVNLGVSYRSSSSSSSIILIYVLYSGFLVRVPMNIMIIITIIVITIIIKIKIIVIIIIILIKQ